MIQSTIYLFLSLALGISASHDNPIICVSNEQCYKGNYADGYRGQKFQAFMGIRYAKPPVGELRFKNPQPYTELQGEYDATLPSIHCLQKNYLTRPPVVSGSEDCLFLNVYRPDVDKATNLAVMVYIHGGGLFTGATHPFILGPEYFMDTKEVILVTFTYRLGAFGFLSTGDKNMEGNFGIKDQTAALKWVQQNIAAFGGNPNAVTIFGQSAGGSAVHLHMLSNASKGLFHKAIAMSGLAIAPFITPLRNPKEQAVKVAQLCKIPNATNLSSEELANALRAIDANELIKAGDGLKNWDVDPLINYRPVVEPSDNPDAFLTADPIEILASGNYTHVPWMTGLVPNEGAVRLLSLYENKTLLKEFNERFDELFEQMLEFPETNLNASNRVVDYYLNGNHKLDNTTFDGFMNALTDRAFRHPFYHSIKEYVKHANLTQSPVFLYEFNYRGLFSYSLAFTGGITNYGVVHCDDLIYLFRTPILFTGIAANATDAAVIDELVGTLIEFAKTGKPKRSEEMQPCNKEAFKNDSNSICDYIEFKNENNSLAVKINNNFNVSAVNFWEGLLKPSSD